MNQLGQPPLLFCMLRTFLSINIEEIKVRLYAASFFGVRGDEIKKNEQYECLLSDERTTKDIFLYISAANLGSF